VSHKTLDEIIDDCKREIQDPKSEIVEINGVIVPKPKLTTGLAFIDPEEAKFWDIVTGKEPNEQD